MRFHIAHIIPQPRMHGLHGYKEVIETVIWGLEQLGHSATYSVNQFDNHATNLVFGGQVLSIDALNELREDTIIYHFEQIRNTEACTIRPEAKHFASRFRIWDYSEFNLSVWQALGTKHPIRIVPVGHAPILERIPKAPTQDIDVLFYGRTDQTRLAAFDVLSRRGLTSIFVSGLYGAARDELISRAKVVLNINFYSASRIFEVPRVAYLLSNKKAVVALKEPDIAIESDLIEGIRFSPSASFMQDCVSLVDSADDRSALEERGYSVMARRDIRTILTSALDQ